MFRLADARKLSWLRSGNQNFKRSAIAQKLCSKLANSPFRALLELRWGERFAKGKKLRTTLVCILSIFVSRKYIMHHTTIMWLCAVNYSFVLYFNWVIAVWCILIGWVLHIRNVWDQYKCNMHLRTGKIVTKLLSLN